MAAVAKAMTLTVVVTGSVAVTGASNSDLIPKTVLVRDVRGRLCIYIRGL